MVCAKLGDYELSATKKVQKELMWKAKYVWKTRLCKTFIYAPQASIVRVNAEYAFYIIICFYELLSGKVYFSLLVVINVLAIS